MVDKSQLVRGEVWYVDFGGPAGDRPAVVLTRASLTARIDQQLVIPCTRTVRGVQTEAQLGPADGMPEACVANAAQATVVDARQIRRRVCLLGEAKLEEIGEALAWFAGLR